MLAYGNLERECSLVKGAQQTGAGSDQQIAKWKTRFPAARMQTKQKRLVDLRPQDATAYGRAHGPAGRSAEDLRGTAQRQGPERRLTPISG